MSELCFSSNKTRPRHGCEIIPVIIKRITRTVEALVLNRYLLGTVIWIKLVHVAASEIRRIDTIPATARINFFRVPCWPAAFAFRYSRAAGRVSVNRTLDAGFASRAPQSRERSEVIVGPKSGDIFGAWLPVQ
jgi:hypothetical protein